MKLLFSAILYSIWYEPVLLSSLFSLFVLDIFKVCLMSMYRSTTCKLSNGELAALQICVLTAFVSITHHRAKFYDWPSNLVLKSYITLLHGMCCVIQLCASRCSLKCRQHTVKRSSKLKKSFIYYDHPHWKFSLYIEVVVSLWRQGTTKGVK